MNIERLDQIEFISDNRPLVIKIDVQGGEFDVLEGARGILETTSRDIVILCEVAPAALRTAGRTTRELATLFNEYGFAVALIDPKHPRIIPMSWQRVVQFAEQAPDSECDIIAYRQFGGLMTPLFR